MVRKFLLPLALAALAGVLFFLLRDHPEHAGAGPGRADSALVGAGELERPLPAQAGASGAVESGRIALPADLLAGGAPGRPVVLQIRTVAVDGSGVVPECELRLFDLAKVDPARMQSIAAGGSVLSPEFLALGEALRTGPRGRLRHAHSGGTLFVVAHGRFLGVASWHPGQDERFDLEVAPRVDFAVKVVDAEGAPAPGVRVVLSARQDRGGSGAHWSRSRAPDGLAEFPDFGIFYASVRGQQQAGFVSATLARPDAEWLSFPLDPLPEEPPVLRLPPAGEILVRVVADHGAARQCTLAALPLDGERRPFLPFRGLTQPVEDGQVLFRHVPLGLRFRATLDLEDSGGPAGAEGSGPTAPGERRELVVDLGGGVSFTGRLLRVDGAPVRAGAWRYRLRSVAGPTSSGDLPLGEDGRFRIRLAPELQDWEFAALEVEAAAGGLVAEPPREQSAARAELAGRYGPGEHALGVMKLVPVPLLVAGRVVAADGQPVAGAVLSVEQLESRNPDFGELWRPVSGTRQGTGPGGLFRIQAYTGSGEFRLVARKAGLYQERPLRFAAGQEDLEVLLPQAGAIEMAVLLPDGFGAEQLQFFAEVSGDLSRRWSGQPPYGRAEPAVLWQGLPPGSYDLELTLRGFEEAVVRRAGILVRPGETTRVAAADLRQRVYLIHISVTDEQGRGMADDAHVGRVNLYGMGSSGGFRAVDDRRFAVPALVQGPRSYIVTADGYRPELLPELSGDAAVVLYPLEPTRLRLPDPLPALDPGLDLRVSLLRQAEAGAATAFTPLMVPLEGKLEPGGELVARFQVSGRYLFYWTWSRQKDGATEQVGSRVSEFELRDEDHGGLIEIPTPPDPR